MAHFLGAFKEKPEDELLVHRQACDHFRREVHFGLGDNTFSLPSHKSVFMKPKTVAIIVLVILAVILTGFGGLRDMFGISLFGLSKEHAWNDGIFLLMLATLVAILKPSDL